MMVRTQISLQPDELAAAKLRANELGVSLAEFIRRAVRRELAPEEQAGDLSAIFAMFDGPSDPVDVDEEVGRALDDEYLRWQAGPDGAAGE